MKRVLIALGMVLGMAWSVAIVVLPLQMGLPFVPPAFALPIALALPGVAMAMMIAVLAMRRFFDPDMIDGQALRPGSRGAIDQAVLRNTSEQLLLALLIWPLIGYGLGGVSLIVLGAGLLLARLLFWLGYHLAPPLRAFGFAASFYPTIFGLFWAVWEVLPNEP